MTGFGTHWRLALPEGMSARDKRLARYHEPDTRRSYGSSDKGTKEKPQAFYRVA